MKSSEDSKKVKKSFKKSELNIALGKHFLEIRDYYLKLEINIEQEILMSKNKKKMSAKKVENTGSSDTNNNASTNFSESIK